MAQEEHIIYGIKYGKHGLREASTSLSIRQFIKRGERTLGKLFRKSFLEQLAFEGIL